MSGFIPATARSETPKSKARRSATSTEILRQIRFTEFFLRRSPAVPPICHAISTPRSGRLGLVYGLDAIENLTEVALRDLHVIIVLQVEPKLCGCPQRLGEPKRSIGGNAGLFAGDPLDPCARQAAGLGESTRRHLQRNQELLA